jgi:hypothetical protein
MVRTLTAIFDGEVLRPEEALDLKPNARYRVTVESEESQEQGLNAWDLLEEFAGSVEAPKDWAAEPDHYLHGTPKKQQKPNS